MENLIWLILQDQRTYLAQAHERYGVFDSKDFCSTFMGLSRVLLAYFAPNFQKFIASLQNLI